MFIERRLHPRFKVSVPVEIHTETSDAPIHSTTSDISMGGCYVENMYPFPVDTKLELKLQVGDTLLIAARVVTCDPNFGNGMKFVRMLDEDYDTLNQFLQSVAAEQAAHPA